MSATRKTTHGAYTVETWYDRRSRNWITQTKDAAGNQISDATYTGNRISANLAHAEHARQISEAKS